MGESALLDCDTQAKEAKLTDTCTLQPPILKEAEYSLKVDRSSSDRPMGIQYEHSDGLSLVIRNIQRGMLFSSMVQQGQDHWVQLGDQIVEVNGLRGDAAVLEAECLKKQVLNMKLVRASIPEDAVPMCLSENPLVVVHVYDLSPPRCKLISCASRALNVFTNRYGLYHTGVEVFGREWYFGHANEYFHGVHAMQPKQHQYHRYRKSIVLGRTEVSSAEFEKQIVHIRTVWPGFSYDVRTRNCHHFTGFLCNYLGFPSSPHFGLYSRSRQPETKCVA